MVDRGVIWRAFLTGMMGEEAADDVMSANLEAKLAFYRLAGVPVAAHCVLRLPYPYEQWRLKAPEAVADGSFSPDTLLSRAQARGLARHWERLAAGGGRRKRASFVDTQLLPFNKWPSSHINVRLHPDLGLSSSVAWTRGGRWGGRRRAAAGGKEVGSGLAMGLHSVLTIFQVRSR